eukprot:CAMPEP_0118644558 /NCGR_PEP_ID=MMETSP0785-20121206/7012_1 /TAXON_ID=91992 /ORGANISM="Bolidomonas pacifica, Strain CCMP 1866" /LENGTH=93 /DNA_ID=CAMNT_0006536343 /DNA_START=722 /DNA_END=1003 /DNA_ORIENTATION=-
MAFFGAQLVVTPSFLLMSVIRTGIISVDFVRSFDVTNCRKPVPNRNALSVDDDVVDDVDDVVEDDVEDGDAANCEDDVVVMCLFVRITDEAWY